MTGIVFIIAGLISLIIGTIIYFSGKENQSDDTLKTIEHAVDIAISDGVLTNNEKDTLPRLATDKKLDAEFVIDTAQRRIVESKTKAETVIIDINKKNGDDFEAYIVEKLNPKYFKIKQWQGDKYANGRYAESNLNPDIIIEFSLGRNTSTFAIECKWRKDLYKGGLEITDDDQLDRYRKFERESGNKVFVAVGLGNEGSSPARLFIIPLSKVKGSFMAIDYLATFEKNEIKKNLYYDEEAGTLR